MKDLNRNVRLFGLPYRAASARQKLKETPGEAPGVEGLVAPGGRAAIHGRDKGYMTTLYLAPQARAQRSGARKKVGWEAHFLFVLSLGSIQRTEGLQLAFESKQLRTICEDEVQAKVEVGEIVAKTLKRRLADLRAATSVKDLVAGNPRLLPETEEKNMAVDLCDGRCLVFTANHVSNPTTPENNLDWSRVTRIKILRIEEGHG